MVSPISSDIRRLLREKPKGWRLDMSVPALVYSDGKFADAPIALAFNGRAAQWGGYGFNFRCFQSWLNRRAILAWIDRHAG